MQEIKVVCPHCTHVNSVIRQEHYEKADCSSCEKSLLDTTPIALTDENFEHFATNSDIPVVVDLWATWCGPCKVMAPIFEEVAKEFPLQARFVKVDTDEEEVTSNRFKLISIPTFVVLKNNKAVAHKLGASSKEDFFAWVKESVK